MFCSIASKDVLCNISFNTATIDDSWVGLVKNKQQITQDDERVGVP